MTFYHTAMDAIQRLFLSDLSYEQYYRAAYYFSSTYLTYELTNTLLQQTTLSSGKQSLLTGIATCLGPVTFPFIVGCMYFSKR